MLPGRSELELPQGREGGLPMPCIIHPPWTTFIHMVDVSHIEAGQKETGSEGGPGSGQRGRCPLHYSCMQITRARSTRTLKFLQESQFEICMHALRIRYCCCHCCSNVDLRLGEAISVESMHGWSHDARILMADGGCVH